MPCAPTLAVTVACWLVVSVVCATPDPSVVTTVAEMDPVVVEKTTGTSGRELPFTSNTLAVMMVEPPRAETVAGFALTRTAPTAAVPTESFSAPAVPVEAPPEKATIEAVPLLPFAMNFTRA